jgi:hypothetical protein
MIDLGTMLDSLRTAALRDVAVPGVVEFGEPPVFRASPNCVHLVMADERRLQLERVDGGVRLSVDAEPPATDDAGVSSIGSLVSDWYDDQPLAGVRYATDARSDPDRAIVRSVEVEFAGDLRVFMDSASLTIGPSYDRWHFRDGLDRHDDLPEVFDPLRVSGLCDVVVPGYVERDRPVPELNAFPTDVYLIYEYGMIRARQVHGGSGVQFTRVPAFEPPEELVDAEEEVGFTSLGPLLLGDVTEPLLTRVRYATDTQWSDVDQGIVAAAELEFGGAVRLFHDPMTTLALNLGVQRDRLSGA